VAGVRRVHQMNNCVMCTDSAAKAVAAAYCCDTYKSKYTLSDATACTVTHSTYAFMNALTARARTDWHAQHCGHHVLEKNTQMLYCAKVSMLTASTVLCDACDTSERPMLLTSSTSQRILHLCCVQTINALQHPNSIDRQHSCWCVYL
jgi:hypothetical protein